MEKVINISEVIENQNNTNNTNIIKEDATMENTNIIKTVEITAGTTTEETTPKAKRGRKPKETAPVTVPETRLGNNIWATYDAKKVVKALEGLDSTERKAWFETMGVNVQNAQSLESALKISGLDFEVEKKPLCFMDTGEIRDGRKMPPRYRTVPGMWATVRNDTHGYLGVVSDEYEILQNRDAFDFLDSLSAMGAKFETAGEYKRNGAGNYVTMSTEPMTILGDKFQPYLMIVNSHDGKGSVRITFTPMRVVCKNTMISALRGSENIITIQHSKRMFDQLVAAKETLLANTNYMNELNKLAEELAVKPFSEEAFRKFCENQFPIRTEDSEVVQIRNLGQIEAMMRAYQQNDLDNFKGTAWKAVQAISDFESHPVTLRKTKKIGESGTKEFQNVVIAGMPMLQMMLKAVGEAV